MGTPRGGLLRTLTGQPDRLRGPFRPEESDMNRPDLLVVALLGGLLSIPGVA